LTALRGFFSGLHRLSVGIANDDFHVLSLLIDSCAAVWQLHVAVRGRHQMNRSLVGSDAEALDEAHGVADKATISGA
jgi:hypothetical protein